MNSGGQYLHVVGDKPVEYSKPVSVVVPQRDFDDLVKQSLTNEFVAQKRQELASSLGVTVKSLEMLGCGWSEDHWTFPERNHCQTVVGINTRYADGSKRQETGGKRGLFYPTNWRSMSGTIYLVEGASDTAAMLSHGHCAIGRPNNIGGIDQLGILLRGIKRQIVVIGENDRRNHNDLKEVVRKKHLPECRGCQACWPGKYGAQQTCIRLAKMLHKSIGILYPPLEFKDVRTMFNAGVTDLKQLKWRS